MVSHCLDDGRWTAVQAFLHPAIVGPAIMGPAIMGIVNVTPDSFFDGGHHDATLAAIAHGQALLAAGARILDIGGESTRPGAMPVPSDLEQARILPVIAALAPVVRAAGALISVDTRHAATMRAALDAGADIINDVTALMGDAAALDIVTAARCPVILMHMQGTPQSMQNAPIYQDVVGEVAGFLRHRVAVCVAAGIPPMRIWVDPGIGFGKTGAHNIELLAGMARLTGIGAGILLGVSRKSVIAHIDSFGGGVCPPAQRLPGSLAALLAVLATTNLAAVRVHDVAETRQALAVWQAISQIR